jgi:hypothetical protein
MSAIDGIRRLIPILELLEVKVWPLHSQMEQKQRLKNLDRCARLQLDSWFQCVKPSSIIQVQIKF